MLSAPITDKPASDPPATDLDQPEGAGFASWYLIIVLTLAYTVSFVDRQVLNLLVGPIKQDFGIDDTMLSLLQGVAFTSAYIIMSPLFGRIADVGSRRGVLIFGIGLWSVGTSCCGMARSYWQLFLARFGVGGAEACLTPAAWSIIADAFPARMIPKAFSVYMMGPYLGGGLALIFGGLLLDGAEDWDLSGVPVLSTMAPWQLVFFTVGLPGLVIAVLMMFVREPARRASPAAAHGSERMSLAEVWAFMRRWRGFYGNFYAGMPLFIISLYAFPAWMPSVLIRRFGVSATQVGVQYGIAVLVTGSVGVLISPWLAQAIERLGRKDQLLLVAAGASALMVPLCIALPFTGSYGAAFTIATLASFVYSVPQALSSSALQLATPNRMRGIASSLYVFVISVAGLGLAPTFVALITDHVFHDETRVGDSLAITCGLAAVAGTFFLSRALKTYREMIDALD
jgi:MFS family permease